MHLKKNHWLVVMWVFLFLAVVAIAWSFIHILKDLEARKSVAGEEIQVVERNDLKVWRGIVKDKPAHYFGSYIEFEVENPSDNQDYKFRLSVIYKPNFKWAQTDSRDFNVGDEILFFRAVVFAEIGKEKVFFCPIGIHYSCVYKGEFVINGYKVANPPKRE